MQSKLDLAIDQVFEDLESESRIQQTDQRAQIVLGSVKEKSPTWTPYDDAILRELLPELGFAGTAKKLGRSTTAIKVRSKRIDAKSPTRNDTYYTANKIAWALNTDSHAVMAWRRRGLIKLEKAPVLGPRPIWRIRREDLLAWVVNPMNWPYFLYTGSFRIRKIRDPKIARMIELRRRRWGDEWLPIGKVSNLLGVDHTQVNHLFIGRRSYRGRKVKWLNWWFVKSDVLASGITFYRGKGQGHQSPKWTPAAHNFMLLALAVGMGNVPTYEMMGSHVMFEAQQKLKSMQSMKALRPLARALGIEVRRRFGEIRMFADWRLYKRQFPSVTRAVSKFLAGQKLRRNEVLLIRRQLFLWAWFFARTNIQFKYAERMKYAGSSLTLKTLRDRYAMLKSWSIDPFAIAEFEKREEVIKHANPIRRSSGRAVARRRRARRRRRR